MLKRIEDCVVVITGSNRGIGEACKKEFLKAGAKMVIGCDLDIYDATRMQPNLEQNERYFMLDVTNPNNWLQLIKTFGKIDVLVNNAGVMPIGPFLQMSDEAVRNLININIWGVMNGTRVVLPEMLNQNYGHIVNIASILGTIPIANAAVYAGTKAFVINFTESLRVEHRKTGVRFSHVLPSAANTQMMSGAKGLVWPPLIKPERVARAVVRAIRYRRTEVWVPKYMKWIIKPGMLLPRHLREFLALNFGVGEMFTQVDKGKRAGYAIRIGGE